MNNYEEIVKELRTKQVKLTKRQIKQIKGVYEDVFKEISEDLKRSRRSSRQLFLKEYEKSLNRYIKHLNSELYNTTKDGIERSAMLGLELDKRITNKMLGDNKIFLRTDINAMFGQIQDNVVADIIGGKLYKDNKTLSERIWKTTKQNKKDIQTIITTGIAKKKTSVELADDLETFVKIPSRRLTDWGETYPTLITRQVDYNAMRLARTSINHSYQTATIQGCYDNPYINYVKWHSALQHGRTCHLCYSRHGKLFALDDVPLDHPNGLCTMIPHIDKSFEEIGEEIGNWIRGATNTKLDKWYKRLH